MEYHNFPFLKLCRIFEDETLIDKYEISKEDWESIKDSFRESYQSPEDVAILEAHKSSIKVAIELNKNIAVIKYILERNTDDWEEYFKMANIKYTGDAKRDQAYLHKQILKLETKAEIYEARAKKLQTEVKESQEK